MTEINKRLLCLIRNNKSINEICEELNMSYKQVLNRLNCIKKAGYDCIFKYFSDGEITLTINENYELNNKINIITFPKEEKLNFMAISDTHIGSPLARMELLYLIYDYCIKKNIHIIFNAGDIIEGQNNIKKDLANEIIYEKEINELIKKYPYDKSILNFICLGNHDYDSLRKKGINVETILANNRVDLIPIGYGSGEVNIKNDKIVLIHPISGIQGKSLENNFILKGHSHKIKMIPTNKMFYVPSLSDIKMEDSPFLPGALEFNVTFKDGYLVNGVVSTLLINDKINKISEMQFNIYSTKTTLNKIKNEEVRVKTKSKEV